MASAWRMAGAQGPVARAMSWPDRAVLIRVPATSANLGPGFDSFGLALARHDLVEVQVRPGGLVIEVSGPGEDLAAAGEQHLVARALRAGLAAIGAGQPPGLAVRCRNAIPQGYGLGSSAAAVVAGLLAARVLVGRAGLSAAAVPDGPVPPGGPMPSDRVVLSYQDVVSYRHVLPDEAVLRLATEFEGHPDNAAACLAGGLTISWTSAAGPRLTRLEPTAQVSPVLCLPSAPMATSAARMVLPPVVPHSDAAANSARAALLVAALTGGDEQLDLLMAATEDFLHQSYRAPAMPHSAGLIAGLRSAGIPAVISGAGPAVLALPPACAPWGTDDVTKIAAGLPGGWQVQPVEVDHHGATVMPGSEPVP